MMGTTRHRVLPRCTQGAQDVYGRNWTQWTETDDGPDWLDEMDVSGRVDTGV